MIFASNNERGNRSLPGAFNTMKIVVADYLDVVFLAQDFGETFLSNVGLLIAGIALLGTVVLTWRFCGPMALRGLRVLTRLVYRLKVIGSEKVPERGAALLAPNHIAFTDGLFLMASSSRPIRFVVSSEVYHKWWISAWNTFALSASPSMSVLTWRRR